MRPDFKLLYHAMVLCNAVYLQDGVAAVAAFEAEGAAVLGRYCDDGHQAIACRIGGRAKLFISGTRVAEGTAMQHITDLYEDIDYAPETVVGQVQVAAGAH